MSNPDKVSLSRRQVLATGVAAAAGWALDVAWIDEAHAQAAALEAHSQYAFADTLADIVIPTTDTPGASAARVGGFLLFALERGMSGLSLALLERLRSALDAKAGGDFLAQSPERRGALVADVDRESYATAQPDTGSPGYAWRRIKSVIVAGYYTSEIGASQELVYEPVPGQLTNIKLTPEFRSRSNDIQGGVL